MKQQVNKIYSIEFKEIEILFNHAFMLLNSSNLKANKNFLLLFETDLQNRFDEQYTFKALNKRDYEQSIELFTQILQLRPNHAFSFEFRGIAFARLKKYHFAELDFCKAIELGCAHYKIWRNLGFVRSKQKDFEASIIDFTKAIELNSNAYYVYYDRANSKYELNLFEAALEDLDLAIEINPAYLEAYEKRFGILNHFNFTFESYLDIEKAFELGSNQKNLHFSRGVLLQSLCNYREAIRDFNHCIELNLENKFSYYYRGLSKLMIHKYEEALIDFDCFIELDPSESNAYYYRGFCYEAIENLGNASNDYQKACELGSNDQREKYSSQALTNIKRLSLKDTYSELKDYIDEHPLNDKVCAISANAKRDNKEYDLAIEHYDLAIKMNPLNSEAFFGRALCKFNCYKYESDKHDSIIEDFNQAIKLKNDVAEYYFERGNVLHYLEKYIDAIVDFDFAIKLNKKFSEAYFYRAESYEKLEKFHEAIEDYSTCIALNPRNAFAYLNRSKLTYLIAEDCDSNLRENAYEDEKKAKELDYRLNYIDLNNYHMNNNSVKDIDQNVNRDNQIIQQIFDNDWDEITKIANEINLTDAENNFLSSLDDFEK